MDAPRPRRTQAERSDESGRRLLAATVEVVATEGVWAATFERIGQVAGYSRGLPAAKFGSKQGMVEALIAHLHERQAAVLAEHHFDSRDGLDALLAYVDLFLGDLEENREGRAYVMLMAGAIADASALRTAFATSHAAAKALFESFVERGQASGHIRSDLDPEAAALMVGSLLIGLGSQWLIDPATKLAPLRRTSIETLRLAFATPAALAGTPPP